jgi:hypothetical protein
MDTEGERRDQQYTDDRWRAARRVSRIRRPPAALISIKVLYGDRA